MSFYLEREVWFDKQAAFRPTRAAIRRYGEDNNFLGSCIVPSQLYPLNRSQYEMFHFRNTELITDEGILDIINRQEFCHGRCYTNTKKMTSALRDAGYAAESYVGWLFINGIAPPIHHCWTVLQAHEQTYVIDLTDDFSVMFFGENGERYRNAASPKERKELLASFEVEAQQYPHQVRCHPLGCPTPGLLYIGLPCDPDEGIRIFNTLMARYPDHECRMGMKDMSQMNETQSILAKRGLMDWVIRPKESIKLDTCVSTYGQNLLYPHRKRCLLMGIFLCS